MPLWAWACPWCQPLLLEPQVPKEEADRKPVDGTKMDKDILARTMEQLRSRVTHKQVVSGHEFKGRPFNSKPKLIHFKVSPENPVGVQEGQTLVQGTGWGSDTSP